MLNQPVAGCPLSPTSIRHQNYRHFCTLVQAKTSTLNCLAASAKEELCDMQEKAEIHDWRGEADLVEMISRTLKIVFQ